MENKKWNWVAGSDKFRVGFVTLTQWVKLGYPAWSWIHSFYLYRDMNQLQFTLFGFNVGFRWKKPPL